MFDSCRGHNYGKAFAPLESAEADPVAHSLHKLEDMFSDWLALVDQNCAQSMGLQNLSSPDERNYWVS